MAWIKRIIYDETTGVSFDYHVIERIALPQWDRTVGEAGWGSGSVTISSYVSRQARVDGFAPISKTSYLVDFLVFGGINWNGQDNLLTWAYDNLQSFLHGENKIDLVDAIGDVVMPGEPYPIDSVTIE